MASREKKFVNWWPAIGEMGGDVRRLSHVFRFSSVPVSVPENTAEHSFWVALYAVMIHAELGGSPDDVGPVLLEALVHDLPECVTGDVLRILKYSTPGMKGEVDRAEAILAEKLLGPRVLSISKLAGATRTRVRKGGAATGGRRYVKDVVKAADFMSLFQYMKREAMRGNQEIAPYFSRMRSDLSKMASGPGAASPLRSFYSDLVDATDLVSDAYLNGGRPNR